MYNSFYSLSFNPFDKQQLPEEDCFKSKDFDELKRQPLIFIEEHSLQR